jgi:hypothetical protein
MKVKKQNLHIVLEKFSSFAPASISSIWNVWNGLQPVLGLSYVTKLIYLVKNPVIVTG